MESLQKRRQNYLQRLNHFNGVINQKKSKSPREIIKKGVQKSTQIQDEEAVEKLVDKALNGEQYVKSGSYDTYLFAIAESIESVRCETTSMNEYFSWIEEGKKIMSHMTDGLVTQDDLDEKVGFIKESWQREAELLTCLGLYERSNNPLAKERHDELLLKLLRLRQIRSALQTETQDNVDKERIAEEERLRNRQIIETLDNLRYYDENGEYQNASVRKQLLDLQIGHFDDAEFRSGYSFYTRMLEEQYRADMQKWRESQFNRHPDEYWAMLKHKYDSKETVSRRILQLSGRKVSSSRPDTVNELVKRQRFQSDAFRRLQKLKEKLALEKV